MHTCSLWSHGGRYEAETFGTGVHACMEMMDRGGEGKLEVRPSGTTALMSLSRDTDNDTSKSSAFNSHTNAIFISKTYTHL